MPTIHQNKLTSVHVDLTTTQAAEVASILRQNDCPYLISENDPSDTTDANVALPHCITFIRGWGALIGPTLDRVMDPDKPVPPSTTAALTLVPPPTDDIAEVFETFTAKAA